MKFYRKSSQQLAELKQKYSEKSWRINLLQMNHISTRDVKDRRREIEQLTDETQSLEKQIKAIEKDLADAKKTEEDKLFPELTDITKTLTPLRQKYLEISKKEHSLNKIWNLQAGQLRQGGKIPPDKSEMSGTMANQDILNTYQEIEETRREKRAIEDELRELELQVRKEYVKAVGSDVDELASTIDKAYQIAEKISIAQAKTNKMMYSCGTLMSYSVSNPVHLDDLEPLAKRIRHFQESNAKLLQK